MAQTAEINKLISEMQDGSEAAFAQIYDRYSASLYGVINKIVGEESVAQDVLQDCFVTIWKKAPSFNSEKGSFFTWMLNICRNKSIDVLRKQNRESGHLNTMKETEALETREAAMNVNTIGMNDIINKLPEEQKIIIEYLYFKGYTQKEVSEELNIPLGTVKTRARYAITELRKTFTTILILWILKNI
ncbi:MAG: RNA polymerase sigma factor [Fluviicola sp.]